MLSGSGILDHRAWRQHKLGTCKCFHCLLIQSMFRKD